MHVFVGWVLGTEPNVKRRGEPESEGAACRGEEGVMKSSRARSSTEWSALRSRHFLETGSSVQGSGYILDFLCPTLL